MRVITHVCDMCRKLLDPPPATTALGSELCEECARKAAEMMRQGVIILDDPPAPPLPKAAIEALKAIDWRARGAIMGRVCWSEDKES